MITPLSLMQVSSAPDFLLIEASPEAMSEALADWRGPGLVARVVRGRKMRNLPSLFDEFAAALQFPWYFGENADAFEECITDLSWLPPQSGYVIVVTEPDEVLVETDALRWLVYSLSRAGREWARPVELGEWWDRPAVPFHVVLQAAAGGAAEVADRWEGAGASVRRGAN